MLAKSRWTYPPLYQQNIEDMRSSFIVIEQLFQDNQTVQQWAPTGGLQS